MILDVGGGREGFEKKTRRFGEEAETDQSRGRDIDQKPVRSPESESFSPRIYTSQSPKFSDNNTEDMHMLYFLNQECW